MPSVASPAESPESHPDITPEAVADRHERFFCTEAVTRDLKRRTVRGGAITVSSQAAKFLLRLGSTAVLARLLTPADFGLIAMVTVITGFVEMFKDAGLSMATIQRERITHAQVSTLFWINVALGVFVMLVIAALAPFISWIYGEARLLWVTIALSGTMIFGGLAVQHQALLRRQMLFGRLAFIEIASMSVGVATAIFFAWQGYAYWSLVAMTASTAATTALMSFLMSGWIPGMPVVGSNVRPMLKFGGQFAGAGWIMYLGRQLDKLLLGYFAGPVTLGYYGRAYSLVVQPWVLLIGPLSDSVNTALCRAISRSRREFIRLFQWSIAILAMLSFGAATFVFLFADQIVDIALGDQWGSAAPIIMAMSPAICAQSIRIATRSLALPCGAPNLLFKWTLVSTPITMAGVAAGMPWGAFGIAVGVSVAEVVSALASVPYFARRLQFSVVSIIAPLVPAVAVSIFALSCFYLASF